MRFKTLISFYVFCLSFHVLYGQAADNERQAYVDRYSYLAVQEMERTGVPASIKLAQAVLESRWGTSTLAREGNNHFGIKCGGSWTGETIYRKDDDYKLGKLVPSCFRAYSSTRESFIAHSNFLISNSRYAGLFVLKKKDYKAWAKGLKNAGYATAKDYHKTLIRLIEELKLYQYDRMSSLDFFPPSTEEEIVENKVENSIPAPTPNRPELREERMKPLSILYNNDVKFVVSNQGRSIESIAKELKIPVKWILSYNEKLELASQMVEPGQRVYIQAKRKNYRGRQKWHEVKAGDSMFELSQRYGISLKHLYNRNRMIFGTEAAEGSKIKLRGAALKSAPELRAITEMKQPEQKTAPKKIAFDYNKSTDKVNLSNLMQEAQSGQSKEKPQNLSSGTVYHKFVLGDNLETIAKKYKVSIVELQKWNDLKPKQIIKVGTQLRVR